MIKSGKELGVKDLSCLRVTESKICMAQPNTTAMNLLHGDHAACKILTGNFLVTMQESHDIGTPCTILTNGWAYSSYNFQTTDVGGDSGRAE